MTQQEQNMTPAEVWARWVGCQTVREFCADVTDLESDVIAYVDEIADDTDTAATRAIVVDRLIVYIGQHCPQ